MNIKIPSYPQKEMGKTVTNKKYQFSAVILSSCCSHQTVSYSSKNPYRSSMLYTNCAFKTIHISEIHFCEDPLKNNVYSLLNSPINISTHVYPLTNLL